MQAILIFCLVNFSLTLLLVTVIFIFVSLFRHRKNIKNLQLYKIIFSYFLFFNIGCFYFYNFIMHVFFGELVAKFIGWEQSPFQLEVGFASLGFSLLGFIGTFSNLSFRSASVISSSVFLLGAAIGHVNQMVIDKNFATGNAGSILWMDFILPCIGFILLYLQYREENFRIIDR